MFVYKVIHIDMPVYFKVVYMCALYALARRFIAGSFAPIIIHCYLSWCSLCFLNFVRDILYDILSEARYSLSNILSIEFYFCMFCDCSATSMCLSYIMVCIWCVWDNKHCVRHRGYRSKMVLCWARCSDPLGLDADNNNIGPIVTENL